MWGRPPCEPACPPLRAGQLPEKELSPPNSTAKPLPPPPSGLPAVDRGWRLRQAKHLLEVHVTGGLRVRARAPLPLHHGPALLTLQHALLGVRARRCCSSSLSELTRERERGVKEARLAGEERQALEGALGAERAARHQVVVHAV
eukprot:2237097-Rhodomonas_salina.1